MNIKNLFNTLGIVIVVIFFYKYYINNTYIYENLESECDSEMISKCLNNKIENNPDIINIKLNQIDSQLNTLNNTLTNIKSTQDGIVNKINTVQEEMNTIGSMGGN